MPVFCNKWQQVRKQWFCSNRKKQSFGVVEVGSTSGSIIEHERTKNQANRCRNERDMTWKCWEVWSCPFLEKWLWQGFLKTAVNSELFSVWECLSDGKVMIIEGGEASYLYIILWNKEECKRFLRVIGKPFGDSQSFPNVPKILYDSLWV